MNTYAIWSIVFVVGVIVGMLNVYIWKRRHPIGTLKIVVDDEGLISAFLELEREMPEVQRMHDVTLRVENHSFNEIN